MNECKKGHQPRTSLIKDEVGDLLAYFHSNGTGRTITSVGSLTKRA